MWHCFALDVLCAGVIVAKERKAGLWEEISRAQVLDASPLSHLLSNVKVSCSSIGSPDSPHQLVGPDSPHHLVRPDSPHQLVWTESQHKLVRPGSPHHLVRPDPPHQLVGLDSPHQLVGPEPPHQLMGANFTTPTGEARFSTGEIIVCFGVKFWREKVRSRNLFSAQYRAHSYDGRGNFHMLHLSVCLCTSQ